MPLHGPEEIRADILAPETGTETEDLLGEIIGGACPRSSLQIKKRNSTIARLPSWHANVGKRLVESPRVYVRDSGPVHALLGLGEKNPWSPIR